MPWMPTCIEWTPVLSGHLHWGETCIEWTPALSAHLHWVDTCIQMIPAFNGYVYWVIICLKSTHMTWVDPALSGHMPYIYTHDLSWPCIEWIHALSIHTWLELTLHWVDTCLTCTHMTWVDPALSGHMPYMYKHDLSWPCIEWSHALHVHTWLELTLHWVDTYIGWTLWEGQVIEQNSL